MPEQPQPNLPTLSTNGAADAPASTTTNDRTIAQLVEDLAVTDMATLAPELWVLSAPPTRAPLGTTPIEPLAELLDRLERWRPPPGAPPLQVELRTRTRKGAFASFYVHTLQPAASLAADRTSALERQLAEERAARVAAEERAAASKPLEGRSVSAADPFETSARTLHLAEQLAARMHPPQASAAPQLTAEAIAAAVKAAMGGASPAGAEEAASATMATAIIGRGLDIGDKLVERLFARLDKRDQSDAQLRQAQLDVERVRAAADAARAQQAVTREKNTLTVVGDDEAAQ